MIRKNKNYIYIILSALILAYAGCTDFPEKLILPTWNVDLNVPVMNRSYTLQDVIDKDTSNIKSYKDGSNLGLLYYSTDKEIEAVAVQDNITLEPISTDATVELDSISIDTPTPLNADISVSEFSPYSPGQTLIIAPFATLATKDISTIQQFQSAIFESASFKITFENRMPVDATLIGFTVKNSADNSILFQANTSFFIGAGQTVIRNFSINEKTIYQNLYLETTITSFGSNGTPVTLSNDAGIGITALIQNFSIFQVTAQLPPQPPFTYNGSLTIDDSTYVQATLFNEGKLVITLDNNLDIDLNIDVVIHNMYDPSGNEFEIHTSLSRKQQNKTITYASLKNYVFRGLNNSLTNQLPYDVTVQTLSSSGVVTLKKFDSVKAIVEVLDIVAQSFSGKIKPTPIVIDDRSISLGLDDIQDKYSIDNINLTDASIKINLKQSAGIEFGYSGQIIGSNGTQTGTMAIPYTILGIGDNTINLSPTEFKNFLNGFTGKLPQTLTIKSSGIANPNYQTGTVSASDSIFGSANIEVPLKIGLNNAAYKDTTDIDIDNDVRNKKDQVEKFSVTMELTNGIAIGTQFSSKLYDEANNFLMDLPPDRAPNSKIVTVPSANIDSNGKVISVNSSKINVDLNKDEIDKFLRAKKIVVNILFSTGGTNNQGVEFRTTDATSIKIYGSVTYKVK